MKKIKQQKFSIYFLAITMLMLFSCDKKNDIEDVLETEQGVNYIEFVIDGERYYQEYESSEVSAITVEENGITNTAVNSIGETASDVTFGLTTSVKSPGSNPLGDSEASGETDKNKTYLTLSTGYSAYFSKSGNINFSKFKNYGLVRGTELEATFSGTFIDPENEKEVKVTNGKIRVNKRF